MKRWYYVGVVLGLATVLGCGKMSEPNRVCRTSCGDEQLGGGHIGNSFEEGHSGSSVTLSSEVLTRDV